MAESNTSTADNEPTRVSSMGWKELYLKEDWWVIWVSLSIIIVPRIIGTINLKVRNKLLHFKNHETHFMVFK